MYSNPGRLNLIIDRYLHFVKCFVKYLLILDKCPFYVYNIGMSLPTTKRKLSQKQEDFLNNLIETKGNLKLSAELAGYSGNHYQVIKSLKHEIVDLASDVLAKEAPSAAFKLVEVLESDKIDIIDISWLCSESICRHLNGISISELYDEEKFNSMAFYELWDILIMLVTQHNQKFCLRAMCRW